MMIKPGELSPDDAFFSFCHSNFALYTYPAGNLPRQVLNDPHMLCIHYSDFVSRTGTPVPLLDQEDEEKEDVPEITSHIRVDGASRAVPPSICICHTRKASLGGRNRSGG